MHGSPYLPAYLALERWVVERTTSERASGTSAAHGASRPGTPIAGARAVVLIAPSEFEGARRLREAGARVTIVGARHREPGFDLRDGVPAIPVPDRSVHLVACIESWASLGADVRAATLREAKRVLTDDGVFAGWSEHSPTSLLDFWTLEGEIATAFARTQMVAQIPWRGFSLAPVTDEDAPLRITMREGLLQRAPEASHYLALGGGTGAAPRLREVIECLLVPVSTEDDAPAVTPAPVVPVIETSQAELERLAVLTRELDEARAWTESSARELAEARAQLRALERERNELQAQLRQAEERPRALDRERSEIHAQLRQAEERLRSRDTDVAVLTRTVHDLEQSVSRVSERADSRGRELEERTHVLAEQRAQLERTHGEREQLARQLEVAVVEREAARSLAVRLETELEIARSRANHLDEQLSHRIDEIGRLAAEVGVLRERAEQQQHLLAQSRARADELGATAAQNIEQGRMLAEVAIDRDRLREEAARRASAIEKLEERLWSTRDDVQRERVENVKLATEVERLREQVERTRAAETVKQNELERFATELRQLELARADLIGVVRSRDEEIARQRRELEAVSSRDADLQNVRHELELRARELGEQSVRIEQLRAREQDAQSQLRRREQQLAEVGNELQRLRRLAEDRGANASALQNELDVRAVELEQLAANVSDLQLQVETLRNERRTAEQHSVGLQEQIEQLGSERELLRRLLREREQELEDLSSVQESSGVELYKLRRELDSAARANERLSEVLQLGAGDGEPDAAERMRDWPPAAVAEVARLRQLLAETTPRPAEVDSGRDESPSADRMRSRRLQRELEIRAEEHERALTMLDGAEQRIWEMSDASDRNAARLAASLAQLERQREQLDETLDELEVTRNLLAAAQARNVENERTLASERAKLARIGASDGRAMDEGVDDLFADLDDLGEAVSTAAPILLPTAAARAASERKTSETPAAAVPVAVEDTGSQTGTGSRPIELRGPARMVAERIADDGWQGEAEETSRPANAGDARKPS